MIYLLYGEDTYRSREKLRELVAEYQKKAGSALSIYRFDAEEECGAVFENMVRGGSLFQEKKLAVAKLLLSRGDAYDILLRFAEELKNSREALLFLWEPGLDKAAAERLKKLEPYLTKAQEFKPLRDNEIRQWVQGEAAKRNIHLGSADSIHLSSFGNDLWALSNELDKLRVGEATSNQQSAVSSIFHLGDTFFSSPREALRHLANLLEQGQDDFSLFSYLSNHVRTLLLVKSFSDMRGPVPINTGIHPFVVKKAMAVTRTIPHDRLRLFLNGFFQEDLHIKTGATKPHESLMRILLH